MVVSLCKLWKIVFLLDSIKALTWSLLYDSKCAHFWLNESLVINGDLTIVSLLFPLIIEFIMKLCKFLPSKYFYYFCLLKYF